MDPRVLLWRREAARVRQVLKACRAGACFQGAGKRAMASAPLERCLAPLEREAAALAASSSPYAYVAGARLVEHAERCSAQPASLDDSLFSQALEAGELQVTLANAQGAAESLARAAALGSAPGPRARLLLARASLAELQARYQEQEELSQQALLLLEKSSDSLLADAERAHGGALANLGRYPEAYRALERALQLREAALGADSLGVADVAQLQAWVLLESLEPERARAAYQRALAIRELKLGPQHPETAMSWNGLGMAQIQLGDRAQAHDDFRRALGSCEAHLGDAHPYVADVLLNLATSYAYIGRVDVAVQLADRGLRIATATRGAEHPEVALSMSMVAQYGLVDDAPGTLEGLERARRAVEQRFGAKHTNTAWATLRVAWGYSKAGQHESAREAAQSATSAMREVFPEDSPVLLYPRRQLAVSLFALGRVSEAEQVAAQVMQTVVARHGVGSQVWQDYQAAFACAERPSRPGHERCPAGTVLVAGAASSSAPDKPNEVCMMPELVSVADYEKCWARKQCTLDSEPSDAPDQRPDSEPVFGVSKDEAAQYCRFLGLRLPTSSEVALARGSGHDCVLDVQKSPLSQQGVRFYADYDSYKSDQSDYGSLRSSDSAIRCVATPAPVSSAARPREPQP